MLVEWLVIGSWPFWLVTAAIIAAIVAAVENEKGLWATVCFVGYLVGLHLCSGVNMLTWARDHVEVIAGGAVGYLILGAGWGVVKWYFFTRKRAATIEEDYKQARRSFLRDGITVPIETSTGEQPKAEQPKPGNPSWVPNAFRRADPNDSNVSVHPSDKPSTRRINVENATEETPVPPELRKAWEEHIQKGYYHSSTTNLKTHIVPPRPNDYKATILTWMTFWPASLFWTMLNDPIRAAFRHIYANLSRTLQEISNKAFKDITQMHEKDTKVDLPPPPPTSADNQTPGPVPPGSTPDVSVVTK